jgi:hypothetical protein
MGSARAWPGTGPTVRTPGRRTSPERFGLLHTLRKDGRPKSAASSKPNYE